MVNNYHVALPTKKTAVYARLNVAYLSVCLMSITLVGIPLVEFLGDNFGQAITTPQYTVAALCSNVYLLTFSILLQ